MDLTGSQKRHLLPEGGNIKRRYSNKSGNGMRIQGTGYTSTAEGLKGSTLKTGMMMALGTIELLGRRGSLGEDNGAYLMHSKLMTE